MTLHIRVIAPDRTVWDAQAQEVILPSSTGQCKSITPICFNFKLAYHAKWNNDSQFYAHRYLNEVYLIKNIEITTNKIK